MCGSNFFTQTLNSPTFATCYLSDKECEIEFSEVKQSNTNKQKSRKIKLDFTIETCIRVGMKPGAIVKVLNAFISENDICEDEFISRTTIRRKINILFNKMAEQHSEDISELEYLGKNNSKYLDLVNLKSSP